MDNIKGQPVALSFLKKILAEKSYGRAFLFIGRKGCGKFTSAISFTEGILNKNPFLSSDFLFYRNDDFSLKTRFFLKQSGGPEFHSLIARYLYYLIGRLSIAISLGEIGGIRLEKLPALNKNVTMQDFRNILEEMLINNRYLEEFNESSAYGRNILAVSEELSKKQRIPIDFIRKAIEFNSIKSSNYRVTVIGDFENATEEAQNAALKLFEEIPQNKIIVLTASTVSGILPTVLSRCVFVPFKNLNNKAIKEIFGLSPCSPYYSIRDFMEDNIYNLKEKRKQLVVDFFSRIAPRIQYSGAFFDFIEGITSDEKKGLSLEFLLELNEFFRQLHLMRQGYIRSVDIEVDFEYKKIGEKLLNAIYTVELKEFSKYISELILRIKYNNVTDYVVLPSLLIDIARWYQRAYHTRVV